ncbi:MAG: alpha/beta hydrolase [Gemmatimonadaceae bacterium]
MIAALVILLLLSGFLFSLWQGQERILFQPPRLYDTSEEPGRVEYVAKDGQALVGYLVGDPRTTRKVLLCFHGNADLAMWQIAWARQVSERTGMTVFLAEYRGYMSLGGRPSYYSTKLDSDAAYEYVQAKLGFEASEIALFGHSLGSAVATELAQRHQPFALLLQSPFTSARAMARLIVSPPVELVWNRMSRIHFDTRNEVSELDVPVSVSHGKRDLIVPFRMGIEIYEAARKKGELLVVEKAGHNDIVDVAGEAYWDWMTAALKSDSH